MRFDQKIFVWWWLVVILMVMMIYLLVNLRFPKVQPASVDLYFARPLVWTSLAILAYLSRQRDPAVQSRASKIPLSVPLLMGLFHIALLVIGGLVAGFGRSPYSHQPLSLFGNAIYLATMLLGIELTRTYIVRVFDRGSRILAVMITAVFFAMVGIPFARYTAVIGGPALFKFFGGTMLPAIAKNFLASLLALLGGPTASLAYLGVLEIFQWFSPLLPDLHWVVTTFVGTIAPALGLYVLKVMVSAQDVVGTEVAAQKSQQANAWILICSFAVALLWFNTGLLGVQPTVISGVSMEPTLVAGDLVITREVAAEQIGVGDIIRFEQEGTFIMHRVISIEQDGHEVHFVTQGDANNVADPPVGVEELRGKVILVVPKIGWVAIGMRKMLSWVR